MALWVWAAIGGLSLPLLPYPTPKQADAFRKKHTIVRSQKVIASDVPKTHKKRRREKLGGGLERAEPSPHMIKLFSNEIELCLHTFELAIVPAIF